MREEASPVCAVVNICDGEHPTIAPPANDRLGESEWVITVWHDAETAITGLYQTCGLTGRVGYVDSARE
jgi:hypothetical protein